MVQGFPVLQRVYKRVAVSVILVVLVKIGAGKHERGRVSAVQLEADLIEITAHAQEKSPSEYVCRF
jgi:hypothetical protein